jgi:hypothetical protein
MWKSLIDILAQRSTIETLPVHRTGTESAAAMRNSCVGTEAKALA